MRTLFFLSSLLLASAPALAVTDSGLIQASGQVTSSCSVGDLNLTLVANGTTELKANGFLYVSQTGDTKWDITKTDNVQGNGFTTELNLRGFSNLQLLSTQALGDTETVTGKQGGNASVDITLTNTNGFDPGLYQTSTTVTCTVQ